MVFCDVDGTLLPRNETKVSSSVLDTLRQLTDKGITVVLASGRPYAQLKALFLPLAHRLVFLCLDGAVVFHKDCVLYKQPLSRKQALAFLENDIPAVVNGREKQYGVNGAEKVGKPLFSAREIGEDFYKIEVLCDTPPKAQPWFRVAHEEAGLTELVAPTADKGSAAKAIMEKFGVVSEQTMAFGDGPNDTALLAVVGHPYRMKGSLETVCPHAVVTEDVVSVLKEQFRLR
jgi:hydroxymethylpyrimidine pyrophosphatase-like HAD family hydrolase